MAIKQTISSMMFDAAVLRVKNKKSFWTTYTKILDVHVYVTVFNNDVLPIVEMTDGKDRFRTNNFGKAVEVLADALVQAIIQ